MEINFDTETHRLEAVYQEDTGDWMTTVYPLDRNCAQTGFIFYKDLMLLMQCLQDASSLKLLRETFGEVMDL